MNIFFFLIILSFDFLLSQEIPNEFIEFHKRKISIDSGKLWSENSIFGPVRKINRNNKTDSLIISSRLGTQIHSRARSFYGYGHFTYKKNFHGYLYSRIVNDPELFQRYSGISRDISRFGFSSGENDQSGICFENNWLIFQFGRGRQSWGAGNDIQLALSENSNAYDFGMLDLDFGRLRVRYFNGYLETDSLFINRYITGRGIEWNNEKNILFGLSEIVIYSGENRILDFSYLNPISTHLEVELNNKQNDLGTDSGNGVWQFSLDYLVRKNLKMSFNYLFDEFVIDKIQKDKNKKSEGGYSLKFIYMPNFFDRNNFTRFYFSIMRVGTNTFRHEDGNNNFVNRNKPLGWFHGSDSREFKLGLNSFNEKYNILINTSFGKRDLGVNSIIEDPYSGYTNYFSGPFPSGDFERVNFLQLEAQWWYKPHISFIGKINHNKIAEHGSLSELNFGIDIYLPILKIL